LPLKTEDFNRANSNWYNSIIEKKKSFGPDKKDKALVIMGSSSDNFSLRWNDFESSMGTSFRELRNDSEFFDVTLCCGNGVDTVPAHKVILAACSPLFHRILSCQKNHQNPLLYLKGIHLNELKAVLDFAFHGEVKIAQDSLDNFLAVAEELAIKGLTTNVKPSDQNISKKAVSAKKKRTITREKNSNLLATKKAKLPHSFDLEESNEVSEVNPNNETIKSEPNYMDPDYHADKNIEEVEEDIVAKDFDTEGDMINDDTIGEEEFEDYETNEGTNELNDNTAENELVDQGDNKDPLEENQQEMAKFVESKYGNPMLLDEGGHVYKSSVKRGRKIYWTCREKNKKCLSKAVTNGIYVIQWTGEQS